ncbi:hypothetical protein UPYG_G00089230 [Umbra pygmaea]|uniref:Uncharacterized protein n=1 Tax=Umbra pygmaea TaxID=75934 RepID=A0ABD0XWW4_UMBPY
MFSTVYITSPAQPLYIKPPPVPVVCSSPASMVAETCVPGGVQTEEDGWLVKQMAQLEKCRMDLQAGAGYWRRV